MDVESVIERLRLSVLNYNADEAVSAAKEAVKLGVDLLKAIEEGLAKGIREVGEKFANGEAFLPELVMAAETMKRALEVLEPELKRKKKERKSLGKVLLGTVAGDIHSIGKTIVGSMLTANGFEVHDIGEDVPAEKFVEKVKELKPDIVGLSALLTTTLPEQRTVIEALKREGLREKVKVIIGGAPASREWAEEIGADGYGADATEAVEVVK
ncbi:corrinoid protein, partial [Candidatus Bathyarchaeota archaeon]|nr:corrinoid protein [Candidatus Bathyarchaeota archaeon]